MIDYPAHLEAMWQKAIAPRLADAPTVISTFAGGGGSSTGYLMAGYRELLAVEWDNNAVETLRLNYPDLDIYHGDIARLTADEVLHRTGLQPGGLDVLDGSPPCQGFSTAGKRDFGDDRNQLFREYVRLLRGLQPRILVMENVSGMVKGKMKLIFADILRELKTSGYLVSARLLNAMYFHVPQSRQRMIFIGVRKDLGIAPSHPKAESRPVTVRQAIGVGIKDGTIDQANGLQRYEVGKWIIRCRAGEQASKYHPRGHFFNAARVPLDKPSQTIPKTGGYSEASLCHFSELRYLTASELRRLSSFPDNYKLIGTLQNAYNRIGNSVPPLFMEAIARHIRTEVLDKSPVLISPASNT